MKTSILATILLFVLLFSFKAIITKKNTLKPKTKLRDGEDFVNNLEKLEYFKYVDQKDINALKKAMVESYDPRNELVSIWDDETGTPKDYRLYLCDSETLFEAGGFISLLKELRPTFEKIGFRITVTNHIEEWDSENNWLNHSITINGHNYTIFKNFTKAGWDEAIQAFADILNTELAMQNKEDRIYLSHYANDGRIIFLGEKQFKYIDSVYRNNQWKPLPVKEWCRVMKVKPQKICTD